MFDGKKDRKSARKKINKREGKRDKRREGEKIRSTVPRCELREISQTRKTHCFACCRRTQRFVPLARGERTSLGPP